MNDGRGLRVETAASVVLKQTMEQYFHAFAHVINQDRAAGKSVHAELTSALAGCVALMIAGGHGSIDDLMGGTVSKLREFVDRDLRHIASGARRL